MCVRARTLIIGYLTRGLCFLLSRIGAVKTAAVAAAAATKRVMGHKVYFMNWGVLPQQCSAVHCIAVLFYYNICATCLALVLLLASLCLSASLVVVVPFFILFLGGFLVDVVSNMCIERERESEREGTTTGVYVCLCLCVRVRVQTCTHTYGRWVREVGK